MADAAFRYGTVQTSVTVYVCGPMTGLPLHNFPAFFRAAIFLRSSGFTVINPAEAAMAQDVDPSQPITDVQYNAFLEIDLQAIREHAQMIVRLPGWEESKGATQELDLASQLGLPIVDAWWEEAEPMAAAVPAE